MFKTLESEKSWESALRADLHFFKEIFCFICFLGQSLSVTSNRMEKKFLWIFDYYIQGDAKNVFEPVNNLPLHF